MKVLQRGINERGMVDREREEKRMDELLYDFFSAISRPFTFFDPRRDCSDYSERRIAFDIMTMLFAKASSASICAYICWASDYFILFLYYSFDALFLGYFYFSLFSIRANNAIKHTVLYLYVARYVGYSYS